MDRIKLTCKIPASQTVAFSHVFWQSGNPLSFFETDWPSWTIFATEIIFEEASNRKSNDETAGNAANRSIYTICHLFLGKNELNKNWLKFDSYCMLLYINYSNLMHNAVGQCKTLKKGRDIVKPSGIHKGSCPPFSRSIALNRTSQWWNRWNIEHRCTNFMVKSDWSSGVQYPQKYGYWSPKRPS